MTTESPGSSKLRILIFNWRDLAHPLAGGAEVYTQRVAEEWIKMGHEVTLFCASVVGQPKYESFNGLKIIRRGGKHSVYREAKKYYKHENRDSFDLVVDVVNTRPFGAVKWAKDVRVTALIFQVCKEIWFYETIFPVALIGRFILEPHWLQQYKNSQVLTISKSSKESLQRYGLTKVDVIPVGFETHRNVIDYKKELTPTVIFVGRLTSNKRPSDAIKAFELLRQTLPNAVLWVVGTGPIAKRLARKQTHGVKLFGRVSDMQKVELISRAHCLIATSVREGWGLVVTEAASHGTHTIVYEVDGLRDSSQSSRGLLTDPTPRALAESLVKFFQNKNSLITRGATPLGVVPWNEVATHFLKTITKAND